MEGWTKKPGTNPSEEVEISTWEGWESRLKGERVPAYVVSGASRRAPPRQLTRALTRDATRALSCGRGRTERSAPERRGAVRPARSQTFGS